MAIKAKKKRIKLINSMKRAIHRINLREDVQYHDQPKAEKRRVYINDDGVGVVENVKILGFRSRNKNRRYAFDGIDPELYEGVPVNIDHPDPDDQRKPRDYISRFGWIEGVYKTMEGLFAKYFYFNPDHCHAKGFLWWAKHKPDKIGFSQNAFGDVYDDDEGEVVDRVNDVRSIDLVADPATTKGIFEALEESSMAGANTEDEIKSKEGKEQKTEHKVGNDVEHDTDEDINIEKNAPIVTFEAEEDDFEDEVKKKEGKESKAEEHKEQLTEDDEEDMEEDDDDDDDDSDSAVSNEGGPSAADDTDSGDGGDEDDEESSGSDDDSKTLSDHGGPDIEDELCSACEKIFRDKKLPLKSKVKKIIHLLKLHHSGLEEAYMPKDLNDAKAHLIEKMGKDESVKLVLEALDQSEVREALRTKKSTIKRLLKDAKLPKEAVTPYFERKLLEATNEREIQEMIEDRRAVTGATTSSKPRSAAGDALLLREGRPAGPEQPKKGMTKEEREKAENEAFEKFEAAVMG